MRLIYFSTLKFIEHTSSHVTIYLSSEITSSSKCLSSGTVTASCIQFGTMVTYTDCVTNRKYIVYKYGQFSGSVHKTYGRGIEWH